MHINKYLQKKNKTLKKIWNLQEIVQLAGNNEFIINRYDIKQQR